VESVSPTPVLAAGFATAVDGARSGGAGFGFAAGLCRTIGAGVGAGFSTGRGASSARGGGSGGGGGGAGSATDASSPPPPPAPPGRGTSDTGSTINCFTHGARTNTSATDQRRRAARRGCAIARQAPPPRARVAGRYSTA
jgi:hypothetical protein